LNARSHQHKRFPEALAFTLNNRMRALLQPPDRLISKLNLRPSDVVVDFGCGPGFFTVPLSRVVARTIGVDVSSRMLEKAAKHAKKSGAVVEFLRSDGAEIKLEDESVDVILLNHVFHEIDDRRRVLAEFRRIMRPSGRLIIVERTRGSRLLAGRFGPPIIDETEVAREMQQAGFTLGQSIAHGSDSIIVGQKSN